MAECVSIVPIGLKYGSVSGKLCAKTLAFCRSSNFNMRKCKSKSIGMILISSHFVLMKILLRLLHMAIRDKQKTVLGLRHFLKLSGNLKYIKNCY